MASGRRGFVKIGKVGKWKCETNKKTGVINCFNPYRRADRSKLNTASGVLTLGKGYRCKTHGEVKVDMPYISEKTGKLVTVKIVVKSGEIVCVPSPALEIIEMVKGKPTGKFVIR